MIEDNGIDQEIRTFDSPLAKESVKVRSVGFETNTDTNLRELKKILKEKKGRGSSGCLVLMAIQVGVELCLFFSTRSRTDGSSSSCEMIMSRFCELKRVVYCANSTAATCVFVVS